jgi:signal transduction histidine kinase
MVATEVATNLAPLAIASGRQLEVLSGASQVVVRANADALRAALSNLVENALAHTLPDTAVTIRVTPEPAVEVIDSGPGVPPEQRGQVFERFWKGDRNGKGAGLGLAIVKHIVTALQGSVSVSDNPHGGAAFTLHFPARSSLRDQPPPTSEQRPGPHYRLRSSGRRSVEK